MHLKKLKSRISASKFRRKVKQGLKRSEVQKAYQPNPKKEKQPQQKIEKRRGRITTSRGSLRIDLRTGKVLNQKGAFGQCKALYTKSTSRLIQPPQGGTIKVDDGR